MTKQRNDDDEILRDGERLTVRMAMMDSIQRSVAQSRLADARERADQAREDYIAALNDAWRSKPAA